MNDYYNLCEINRNNKKTFKLTTIQEQEVQENSNLLDSDSGDPYSSEFDSAESHTYEDIDEVLSEQLQIVSTRPTNKLRSRFAFLKGNNLAGKIKNLLNPVEDQDEIDIGDRSVNSFGLPKQPFLSEEELGHLKEASDIHSSFNPRRKELLDINSLTDLGQKIQTGQIPFLNRAKLSLQRSYTDISNKMNPMKSTNNQKKKGKKENKKSTKEHDTTLRRSNRKTGITNESLREDFKLDVAKDSEVTLDIKGSKQDQEIEKMDQQSISESLHLESRNLEDESNLSSEQNDDSDKELDNDNQKRDSDSDKQQKMEGDNNEEKEDIDPISPKSSLTDIVIDTIKQGKKILRPKKPVKEDYLESNLEYIIEKEIKKRIDPLLKEIENLRNQIANLKIQIEGPMNRSKSYASKDHAEKLLISKVKSHRSPTKRRISVDRHDSETSLESTGDEMEVDQEDNSEDDDDFLSIPKRTTNKKIKTVSKQDKKLTRKSTSISSDTTLDFATKFLTNLSGSNKAKNLRKERVDEPAATYSRLISETKEKTSGKTKIKYYNNFKELKSVSDYDGVLTDLGVAFSEILSGPGSCSWEQFKEVQLDVNKSISRKHNIALDISHSDYKSFMRSLRRKLVGDDL